MVPLALGIVITDANVVTLSREQPSAHHVAIVDGRFAYVGDDLAAARKAAGAGAQIVDARGATVLPGFNDAHVHFGLSLTIGADDAIDLQDGPETRAALDRAILRAAAQPIGTDMHDWIFVVARTVPAEVTMARDLPSTTRPLFVVTEHGGILNAVGQKRLHLSEEDAPHGQIRGRLLPAALDRIVKSFPMNVLRAGARRFLAEAAKLGLTSVQLLDDLPELFESLRVEGALTARVRMIVFGYRFETSQYEPTWKAMDPQLVQLDAVKYFHDDWARLPRIELKHIYEAAQRNGRQVVLHVLSRYALRSLLDQLEQLERQSPGGAKHFRIDHADDVSPDLAARIKRLGIIVCPNPAMLPEWHAERAFPMHTLLQAGVTLGIGSDYVGRHRPARPLAPLFGLQMAATHGGYGTREQISVDEALTAFTRGSAEAEGRADLGAIRVGDAADLVGLAMDPRAVPADHIADIEVRFTMMGGKIVYQRWAPPTSPPPATMGPAGTAGPKPTRVQPPPTIAPAK